MSWMRVAPIAAVVVASLGAPACSSGSATGGDAGGDAAVVACPMPGDLCAALPITAVNAACGITTVTMTMPIQMDGDPSFSACVYASATAPIFDVRRICFPGGVPEALTSYNELHDRDVGTDVMQEDLTGVGDLGVFRFTAQGMLGMMYAQIGNTMISIVAYGATDYASAKSCTTSIEAAVRAAQ